jgi:hypothetical protein
VTSAAGSTRGSGVPGWLASRVLAAGAAGESAVSQL